MSAITITVPVPPNALSPNARPHWAVKMKAKQKYRRDACLASIHAINTAGIDWAPMWKMAYAQITVYKRTAHTGDRDNIIASLKAAFDGIADAGVIANDSGLIPLPPTVLKDAKKPRVEITVTPCTEP